MKPDKAEPVRKSLAETIREHIANLQGIRADLVASREDMRAEIETLYAAPVNRADALQFCLDYIDARAAEFPGGVGKLGAVFDFVAWPRRYEVPAGGIPGSSRGAALNLRDIDAGLGADAARRKHHFADGLNFFRSNPAYGLGDDAFYFFFGDLIKAKLAAHFEAFYPVLSGSDAAQMGPPIAERRQRIAELEAKIEVIDAEVGKLNSELAAIRSDAMAQHDAAAATAATAVRDARERTPVDERQRDYAIYRDFNGSNADAIAQQYRVSVAHVKAVGARATAPEL